MAWTLTPIAATPTDLYTLLPQIGAELPSCPEPVQKMALRQSAQRFCRDTEIWQEKLAPTTTASMTSVELNALLEASYDASVLRVKGVWFPTNGRTVYEDQYRLEPNGGDMNLIFISAGIDTALVVDDSDGDMEVQVIADPDDTCAAYPAWLLRRWATAICAGALAVLRRQPRKPWTDQQAGQTNQRDYDIACGDAKAAVSTNRKGGDLMIQPNQFT